MNGKEKRRPGAGPLLGLTYLAIWLCVAATAIGLIGSVVYTFDFINHLRPFLIVVLLLAAVVIYRRKTINRRIRWVLPLTILVNLYFVGAPSVQGLFGPSAESGGALVIAQLNLNNATYPTEPLMTFIENRSVDVLIFQNAEPENRAMIEALTPLLPHSADCIAVTGCGLALLSRQPLQDVQIWHRTVEELAGWSVPALSAKILNTPGGQPLTLIGTHLARPSSSSLLTRQLADLSGLVAKLSSTDIVLGGDMNLTPWSFALPQFADSSGLNWVPNVRPTWPVPAPDSWMPGAVLPIDHFFASPSVNVVNVGVGEALGPDHYPIFIGIDATN